MKYNSKYLYYILTVQGEAVTAAEEFVVNSGQGLWRVTQLRSVD